MSSKPSPFKPCLTPVVSNRFPPRIQSHPPRTFGVHFQRPVGGVWPLAFLRSRYAHHIALEFNHRTRICRSPDHRGHTRSLDQAQQFSYGHPDIQAKITFQARDACDSPRTSPGPGAGHDTSARCSPRRNPISPLSSESRAISISPRKMNRLCVKRSGRFFPICTPAFPISPLRLLSSLAPGADQIAVEAVLTLPFPVEIAAPLPFPVSVYAESHQLQAERAGARDRLIGWMKDGTVRGFVVPISILDGPETDAIDHWKRWAADETLRRTCYANAGGYIARKSFALIALWDGRPSPRASGTEEIVGPQAHRKNPPVLSRPQAARRQRGNRSRFITFMRLVRMPTHRRERPGLSAFSLRTKTSRLVQWS